MQSAIRSLEAEFKTLQDTAFRIGRESADNQELARHPDVNNYVQGMRTFKPKLESTIADIEREYKRVTGKSVERPKKKKKAAKTIRGLSEADIRARTSRKIAQDDRPFRTKAMDLVSVFCERQLQTQDHQRDMQIAMDGPDWPKEDWPLTSADAK